MSSFGESEVKKLRRMLELQELVSRVELTAFFFILMKGYEEGERIDQTFLLDSIIKVFTSMERLEANGYSKEESVNAIRTLAKTFSIILKGLKVNSSNETNLVDYVYEQLEGRIRNRLINREEPLLENSAQQILLILGDELDQIKNPRSSSSSSSSSAPKRVKEDVDSVPMIDLTLKEDDDTVSISSAVTIPNSQRKVCADCGLLKRKE